MLFLFNKYILHSIHLCDFHLFCCIQAGSRLRIPNVERSDEGRYVCTDDNGRIQYVKLVIAGKHKINVSFAVLTGEDKMSRLNQHFDLLFQLTIILLVVLWFRILIYMCEQKSITIKHEFEIRILIWIVSELLLILILFIHWCWYIWFLLH